MTKSFAEYVDEVVAQLPVTKPVFVAEVEPGSIYFRQKEVADLNVNPDTMPDGVERLIANLSSENFRRDTNNPSNSKFVRETSCGSVFTKIADVVIKVYEANCGLKNPRTSNMHKWLSSIRTGSDPEVVRGFVALYRYISNHTYVEGRRFDGPLDKAHANNVLAILGKMRSKYER